MLWTPIMLADTSYGQDVPKLIRHEHAVWELHPENFELDTRSFGDGSLRHGRMKRRARGGRGRAVLNEDMKVTMKLQGPLPGLHQDIGECCLFVVPAARQRDVRHFLHAP